MSFTVFNNHQQFPVRKLLIKRLEVRRYEKNYIRWVLARCEGNKTRAAKIMGIDRVSLWRKLKRFGIDK
ncbi:MAG: hypothetical protein KAR15_02175 [Desulfobacterales bacterium]|nr:hypothetical protein [Desulfobacterales bacterium]